MLYIFIKMYEEICLPSGPVRIPFVLKIWFNLPEKWQLKDLLKSMK